MSVALMTKMAHWAFFVFIANLYWLVLIFLFPYLSLPILSHCFWSGSTSTSTPIDAILQCHMMPSNDIFQ